MAEYIDRKELMKHISPIVYKDGYIANNMASKIVYEIQCESTADVIERFEYEKIKFERDISIQQIHDLGNSVSKAIEEMNNIDLNKYADNSYQLVNECIDILKRNI